MKYTHKVKLKDGTLAYRFVAPKDAKLAGVVENQSFRDGRKARFEIPKLIKIVEDFRRGKILAGNISINSNFKQVIGHYLNTGQFNSLSSNTRKTYEHTLYAICDSQLFSRSLGDITLKYLTPAHCSELYEGWVRGVSVDNANQKARVFSMLMNYCISIGLIDKNPMSRIKKRKHEPKSIIWTRDQVELFLDTAFSDFKYRNIGLLVMMCYEWGQRPTDIMHLKWDFIEPPIEEDTGIVTIKQSKRGATVKLPIEEKLMHYLTVQHNDWSFQEYVIPYQRPSDGCYRPMTPVQVSTLMKEVKALCGLPMELQAGHLRKTAIVEMIQNGADQLAIMSVTGHQNVQSLNPYNKHNYETARSALDMRRG